MHIDRYRFGEIVIDGKTFSSDVIIYPERVDSSWWRREGHRLCGEDLAPVLAASPELLIVGTGYSGVMEVPKETRELLASKGIEVLVERTGRAVEIYNGEQVRRRVIAALHLTG